MKIPSEVPVPGGSRDFGKYCWLCVHCNGYAETGDSRGWECGNNSSLISLEEQWKDCGEFQVRVDENESLDVLLGLAP